MSAIYVYTPSGGSATQITSDLLTFEGAYNPSGSYVFGQVAWQSGVNFLATQDTSGNAPGWDSAYWAPLKLTGPWHQPKPVPAADPNLPYTSMGYGNTFVYVGREGQQRVVAGQSLKQRGAWDQTVVYTGGDVVDYATSQFISLFQNFGQAPAGIYEGQWAALSQAYVSNPIPPAPSGAPASSPVSTLEAQIAALTTNLTNMQGVLSLIQAGGLHGPTDPPSGMGVPGAVYVNDLTQELWWKTANGWVGGTE